MFHKKTPSFTPFPYWNGYIYLIQEKDNVDNNIYTIGRTESGYEKGSLKKIDGYEEGYKEILIIPCENSEGKEIELKNIFKEKFVHIGKSFQGDVEEMKREIEKICNPEKIKND